ncbi:hypothetical protein M4I32_08645 [Microbacterium sp. LRZ72]|uniref:hypothetical protein n=1 Tax=Microbacterium sp. LRZ72 TaxID=2942481 RepID=UPI0029AC2E71|nr:hypothetical protein [Microbacterium sp. LRZ72]MDX2376865.1 hypothetical protein [Microbacterium sp. LRZ72]
MFVVALILFIAGMYLTGFAFSITEWQAFVFVGGILLVSLAVALPIHIQRR